MRAEPSVSRAGRRGDCLSPRKARPQTATHVEILKSAAAAFRRRGYHRAPVEEIATALADLAKARERIVLFKTGIIPQATQTVDSMRAAYLVNKVDFLNLVRAEITLYDYETQYWKAVSEAQQAAATLAAAVGEETIDD